jgi:hypothetical protein
MPSPKKVSRTRKASPAPADVALPPDVQAAPKSAFGRFCAVGHPLDKPDTHEQTRPWYLVIWLTGVDYFSTLGYQPGIALLAAGALAEPATVILVLVTLFGAVPVYAKVAGLSYAGQGSIALLENLFSGWKSKIFVLVLLGFAGTDFVITMTLSAADAARHAIANPYLHPYLHHSQILLTLGLLALLAVVFLMGFREAIGLAAAVAIPYILLNAIVMIWCVRHILAGPALMSHWIYRMHSSGDWTAIFVASALVFPKLALGLSGFETGVSVMPLVSGGDDDKKKPGEKSSSKPKGRIRATRKLLLAAALLMSVMLLTSSFITSLLIPPNDYRAGGSADGRAIAYLAHQYLGNRFGTLYDLSTLLVLWFAGASAMTGLLNLIPRYLPRFGMAPRWVVYRRPLVLLLLAINVIITLIFRANVEAQGSAYATGVLVLMLSAAVAVALALSREHPKSPAKIFSTGYFWLVSAIFAYTLIANVIERPAGVMIAGVFILLLVVTSAISRYHRATEMRVSEVRLVDEESARLWDSIRGKKVNIVPQHYSDREYREQLLRKVEANFKIDGPLAFLHVNLLDNRSEFLSSLRVSVEKEGDNFVIEAWGAVAIANSIAYLSELLDPKTIVLGLTRRNLMQQSLAYAFWGEGEIGLTVYSVLVRHWETTKRTSDLPRVLLISD